jgi:single-stranded DNA-binding protein
VLGKRVFHSQWKNPMPIEATFFGSLSRDAERKTSKNDKAYLRLNVRVENGEKSLFVNVMTFDQEAVAAADKLVNGARVYVEGKLDLNEWTAEDGVVRRGLPCLSFHNRHSQIGRNKPAKTKQDLPSSTPAPKRQRRYG